MNSKTCVSVRQFGAVGDGVADDTAAIQAALDSGAVQVEIPTGLYRVTATLRVHSHTEVRAADTARVYLVLADAEEADCEHGA